MNQKKIISWLDTFSFSVSFEYPIFYWHFITHSLYYPYHLSATKPIFFISWLTREGTGMIGRDHEKRMLERLYQSKKAEFIAVYGRRRVGKTFLVEEAFVLFQKGNLMIAGVLLPTPSSR